MDWFLINNVRGVGNKKMLINAETITSVYYEENTNLTVINLTRSAYPSIFVEGNIMPDICRLLDAHDHYVSHIGG